MSRTLAFLRQVWHDRSAVSAIEFAMILPFLVLLLTGTIEFGRLIMVSQKLQNASFTLGDIVVRDKELTKAKLADYFLVVDTLMQPYSFTHAGTAVVTSITALANKKTLINWQSIGAGDLAATSTIGKVGAVAKLPTGLTMAEGETLVVAEVFYDYHTVFGVPPGQYRLQKITYFKPRLGALDVLKP